MHSIKETKEAATKKYDLLAEKFQKLYTEGSERSSSGMKKALEASRSQLVTAGTFTAEQSHDFKRYMARDLEQTINEFQQLGAATKQSLSPSRIGSGALSSLVAILEVSGNALQSLGDKAKAKLTYKTGEITSAGTLHCNACHHALTVTTTGHIPPCPECEATEFTKSY
ncbi:zinc ribbon-containing protein [Thalassolituus sp.]|jgi:isocitrate dehydrogenase|uniref:zinc ribbon-containing protein n=1 Tax=Thalassolituus sp. TaxID=2030822 RepID=UPI002A7F9EDB|nr:hypothetical protein [Thalassolituus sp.]|tara:strand:- start:11900 stop:12406 length:507 start_codon:yes stop_codon:yes gene_type:complete